MTLLHMLKDRKDSIVAFAVAAIVLTAALCVVATISMVRGQITRASHRNRLVLVSVAIREYAAMHGRLPLATDMSDQAGRALSWRVVVAPVAQDISVRGTVSRESKGNAPIPTGWPFDEGAGFTSIVAVVQTTGPWLNNEPDDTIRSRLNPRTIIALSSPDIHVPWNSTTDIYADSHGVWLTDVISNKQTPIHELRECIVFLLNGELEFHAGAVDAAQLVGSGKEPEAERG
jgi:hypothetical protein